MIRIVSVEPLDSYKLRLSFSDQTEGVVDLSEIEKKGVFSTWSEEAYFRSVAVDPQSGTVVWPNGADLDPYVLYAAAKKISIDEALNAAFHDA